MKRRILTVALVLTLCLCLTGCKSSDYKKAVGLQKSGDYQAAAEMFKAVLLFVENNSGKTLSFTYDDVAINNKMVIEMMSGGQVVSPAIQVVEMNRTLLSMWNDDVPQNKDISVIDFKLSFMPIESDGSFSTGNMYSSDRITLTR